jgi:2-haloacid dehalogenase
MDKNMAAPNKAIIFDFGGVLLRWDPRRLFQRSFPEGPQAVEAFMDEIGFVEWHIQQDLGRPFVEAIAERTAKFPHYAHILADYDTCYEDAVIGSIDETVEILRQVKQAGYPLYGLSNYPTEKFALARRRYEFFGWFNHILISGEVRLVKPDPAIFHLLLERIGHKAEDCIFIDDSGPNITSARALGFTAIHFSSPEQLEQELHRLGIL